MGRWQSHINMLTQQISVLCEDRCLWSVWSMGMNDSDMKALVTC